MVKVYYSYIFDKAVGFVSSTISNFSINKARKIIITASSQYLLLLSLKTGQVIQTLYRIGHNNHLRFIKSTPTKVYTTYDGGEIVIWSLQNNEVVSVLDQHKSTVVSLSVSQDQTRLVSGGQDGMIIIWDLLSQQYKTIKSAHGNSVTQVEFTTIMIKSKPTNVILSTGKDGFFKIWDAQTLLCLGVLTVGATEATSFAFCGQNNYVYVGNNKQQLLVVKIGGEGDVCSLGGIIKRKNYTRSQQIIKQYNKLYILTAKKIQIYQLLNDQKLKQRIKRLANRRKTQEKDIINQTQLSKQQAHLVSLEQKVLLTKTYNILVDEGKVIANYGTQIGYVGQDSIAIGSQKTYQIQMDYPFVAQRTTKSINIYNYGTFTSLFNVPIKAKWVCLFNSGYLSIVQQQGIIIWDLAKNEQVFKLSGQFEGMWIKGTKALLWKQNQMGIYDVGADNKGKIKFRLKNTKYFEDKIMGSMYSPSGQRWAVSLMNNQIHINFSDTGKTALKLYGHKLPIGGFDISSDDALVVSGGADKDLKIWDMQFGHCIKSIFAHAEPITAVKFLKDTHYIISGSKDGHIKFWDGDTHQLIMDFDQNIKEIKTISASNAGDYLLAGGLDGGFRVWKQSGDQTVATDQQEKQAEKALIEDYANQKLGQKQQKTRYQDLKHGQQIIQALQRKDQPIVIINMLKKISPSNLKSSLSFLHVSHVKLLSKILQSLIINGCQVQICWRIIQALDRPNLLSPSLRKIWEETLKTLRINRQALKLLIKSLKQEKQLRF